MKRNTIHTLSAVVLSAVVGASSISAAAGAPPQLQASPTVSPVAHMGKGFQLDGHRAYFHGHRGYRERRRGYREHNGFWFPLAAFGLGAMIGNAATRSNSAHIEWCYDHYRSYRAYDNTYQPYDGPRRECNSPYG